jgi:hypothetical protein
MRHKLAQLSLLLVACSATLVDWQGEPNKEAGPMDLTIAERGNQQRDCICLEATVRNVSKGPIRWDREFSIFLQWQLLVNNDNRLLRPETLAKVRQTRASLAKSRFVTLQPGEALKKEFILTKQVRVFRAEAWGGSQETRHPTHFDGYESFERYRIGPGVKILQIRLVYDRFGRDWMAFKSLFGFDSKEVGLLEPGTYRSNELTIKFP